MTRSARVGKWRYMVPIPTPAAAVLSRTAPLPLAAALQSGAMLRIVSGAAFRFSLCHNGRTRRPHVTHDRSPVRDRDGATTGHLPRRAAGMARGGLDPADQACVGVRSPPADRR